MKLQLIDKKTLNIHWYERVENWEWRNRWVNESKDSYGNWVYRWDYMRRQYTWIKDKNWVEIYEGDVIEEGVVYFDDEYLGFFVKGDFVEGEHKPLYDIPLPEIIGNVTENPELLEK